MLLISGEVGERKRIFRPAHYAQIALNAGTQPHARFGGALRNDRFHQRMSDKKLRDRVRLFRRHNQIDVVHDFSPPPITASDIDLKRVGMRSEVLFQCFGLRRNLAKLKIIGMLCPSLDCLGNLCLGGFPKTRQFSDLARLTRLSQFLDRADFQLLIERLDLFRTQSGD